MSYIDSWYSIHEDGSLTFFIKAYYACFDSSQGTSMNDALHTHLYTMLFPRSVVWTSWEGDSQGYTTRSDGYSFKALILKSCLPSPRLWAWVTPSLIFICMSLSVNMCMWICMHLCTSAYTFACVCGRLHIFCTCALLHVCTRTMP